MGEEFQQAGLCAAGNYFWWNNPTPSAASPLNINDEAVAGSSGWPTTAADKKTTSSCDEYDATAGAASDSSVDVQKAESAELLQIMGFGLSSSGWNQPNHLLRGGGGGETNFNSMLQEDMSCSISQQPPKSFSSEEDDSPSSFNHTQIMNQDLNNSHSLINCSYANTNSNNYSCSSLLQTLLEPDHQQQQQQQQASLLNNGSINFNSSSMATTATPELNRPNSWQKLSPFLQQPPSGGMHFSNNTPFWNATAAPSLSHNQIRATFFNPHFVTPTFEDKPNSPNLFATKTKTNEDGDSMLGMKKGNTTDQQPSFKRPRIETPSPLPTFKVRKEKLGDRITALQQLVSPFGKTDTASVLHEAIEYIKFLHDQVRVLSTPYMKSGAPLHHQRQQGSSHHHNHQKVMKETEYGEGRQDLGSRGLCLVPISSTFPVANETTADFWTPTFGATFR